MARKTAPATPAAPARKERQHTTKTPQAAFRFQVSIGQNQITEEEIRKLATRRGNPRLTDFSADSYPDRSTEKTVALNEVRSLILDAAKDVANGEVSGEGYKLSDLPEEYFKEARKEIRKDSEGKPVEAVSQAEALRDFLRIEKDQPIVLTEAELVAAALKAARSNLRSANYGIEDLIREGISMVAQSMISKHIATENSVGKAPDNIAGSRDNVYLEALNRLRILIGDRDAWFTRFPRSKQITVSVLAREAGTNDVQIRAFLQRHGITDVYDPKAGK